MPVLPPTELSTCASSVVGIWTKSTPRSSDRGGEAGEIADHAAAQRHQHRAALDRRAQQLVQQLAADGRSSWSASPAGSTITAVAAIPARSRPRAARQVQRGDAFVGHDDTRRSPSSGAMRAPGLAEQPCTDHDLVAALAELDAQISLDAQRRRSGSRCRLPSALACRHAQRRQTRSTCPSGGAVDAVDRDVGLGIDRDSAALSARPASRADRPACSSGRLSRRATRASSMSRSARSQTEMPRSPDQRRGSARSMKAPPPVASTCGGSSSSRAITRRSPSRNCRLAVTLEDLGDGAAGGRLDLVVGIDERQTQAGRQPAADAVLPAPISPTSTTVRGTTRRGNAGCCDAKGWWAIMEATGSSAMRFGNR